MSIDLPSSLDTQTVAASLAAFSAFAAVLALALPASPASRLQARLRGVARERDRLRSMRLAELSAREAKGRLRLKPRGMAARLAGLWRGNTPETASDLAAKLKMAGLRGPGPEALFLFCRVALPVLFIAASIGLGLLRDLPPSRTLTLALASAFLGYSLPRFILTRMVARRQKSILRAFPDALDLLLICIQSGMSVEAALGRVTSEMASQSIELAEELSLTMAELSYLPSRWRAYHNLGERTGLAPVKLIAAALAQAEHYGTSIGQAMAAAGRECREMRLFEAERKAAALPPKLTVPLVVFFLPVLMAVIMAPAGMKAGSVLKSYRQGAIAKPGEPALTRPRRALSTRPQAQDGPR